MLNKKYTSEEALQKIKHYCSYQERCHKEVKEKLYSFGLYKQDVEQILTQLIEEDYLDEERFAKEFAGGKFRIKHWGKIKIKHELQQKGVSTYCIKSGLKVIDESEYEKTLTKLAEKKWETLKGEHHLTKQAKLYSYLLQKGYEPDLIKKATLALKGS